LCGKNEPNDEWIDIATKIKVLYDAQLDYHPQYEDYELGTEIKQADAVLVGYPLLFPMNLSTRINDLQFYGNATRDSGPAMSTSMYAINYLDVDDETKANAMLISSFKPFIRRPFNVWSEVIEGEEGATNFITGAGGFLQTVLNGFLGIRLKLQHLEIRNPRRPQNCTNLRVSGISYLKSKFELQINESGRFMRFVQLHDELMLEKTGGELVMIAENSICKWFEMSMEHILFKRESLFCR
jgi:protein-glucosylgalactosylhydroxylysine glucosidase